MTNEERAKVVKGVDDILSDWTSSGMLIICVRLWLLFVRR